MTMLFPLSKKAAANRRNGKRSNGPRTTQGKKWSRRNALKHGILTSALLLTDGSSEDAAEFQGLFSALREDFDPVGQLEELLVEKITVCWWRLQRVLRFEGDAIARASNEAQLINEGAPKPAEMVQLIQEAVEEAEEIVREATSAANPMVLRRLHWIHYPDEVRQQEYVKRLRLIRNDDNLDQLIQDMVLRRAKEMGLEAVCRPDAASQPADASSPQTPEPKPQFLFQLEPRPFSLPAEKDLNRIIKYEASLHRQLAYAMNQLERLQRARKGEHVPAPVSLQVVRDE